MVRKSDLHLRALISEPFRDPNFRRLLGFLGSWNGAVNLAAPFFTVYMLKRLQLDMTTILVLSVISQVANVLFLRLWGYLADRYSNKSALYIAGPLFMLSTALWPLTTKPEKYMLTLPLLVVIHILTGISTAGVTLCTGNIALELSPPGKATAYLAVNAMVSGIAATAAPILGGIAATWLDGQQLTVELRWTSYLSGMTWQMPAFDVRGLDFLFLASALIGFHSLRRLIMVQEEGEVEEEIVLGEFQTEIRKAVRNISNVAGLRDLFYFPYDRLTLEEAVEGREESGR